jgi:hypothetical protein
MAHGSLQRARHCGLFADTVVARRRELGAQSVIIVPRAPDDDGLVLE